MKNKQSKKIDKKALKEKLKKFGFWTLNITCYVATALFIISLIVGACSKPQQSVENEKPVSTMVLRNNLSRLALPTTYYTDLSSIPISTSSRQIATFAGYTDNYYAYESPTWQDCNNLFGSLSLSENHHYYIDLVDTISSGRDYDIVRFSKLTTGHYIIRLYKRGSRTCK